MEVDQAKKALPYKELKSLPKDMFTDQGRGKSFLDEFFERAYEVITKDQKAFLSLPDLEYTPLLAAKRRHPPREKLTGLTLIPFLPKKI